MTGSNNGDGNNQLPVSNDHILRNMRAAVPVRRGAANVSYTRLDKDTGAIIFGRDNIPLPLNHLYAVPWREVRWGYKEFTGRKVVNAVMPPVAAGPCPMPAGDFTPFGIDGPKACMELRLCSITEPGFTTVYSSLNDSCISRILDLWGEIAAQFSVNPDFANPVVKVVPDSYTNHYGTTFVIVYQVVDWAGDDGATLLSKVGPAAPSLTGGAEAEAPF